MTSRLGWSSLALLAVITPSVVPGLARAAGNVEVDSRRIRGDEAANRIKVEPGSGGRVLVSGLDGTTVNGLPAAFVVFDDKTILVKLEQGDDTLVLQDFGVATKLTVHLGPGDDAFAWTGGSVGESVHLDGDDGADEIAVAGVSIGYNATIDGGPEDDDLSIDGVVVKHSLSVKGGRGDDTVVATNLALRSTFHVSTIDGTDHVTIERSTFFGTFRVQLGSEDDDLLVGDVLTDARAIMDGGPGVNVYTNGGNNRFRDGLTFENFEQAP